MNRVPSVLLGLLLPILVACSPQPVRIVERERLIVPPLPACDPQVLDALWDPEFESFGKPNALLIEEFDRRDDALRYAGRALACWRGWGEDIQHLAPAEPRK